MKNNTAWNPQKTKELFEAVLKLKNLNECRKFFRDLCTLEEIAKLTDRWQIAKLINREIPHRNVAKELEVSTTTVSRVAHQVDYGQGGYQLILDRMKRKK